MKRLLAVFGILFLLSVSALAQDIAVEAEISRKQIALGESARLTVTVQGSQTADPPQAPVIDGLDFRYLGPSTQVSIVNGQYSSSVAYTYSVFPMKAGAYEIPSLTVAADGKSFQTTPISLTVTASAAKSSADPNRQTTDLADKMRVLLKTSRTDVYLQEPVPVTVYLLVASDVQMGDVYLPQLPADGFEKGEFQHKRYYQIVDGIRYRVDELQTMIYPQRTGALTVGPAEVPFNIIVDADQSDDMFGSRGGFFSDPFFSSFFSRQKSQTLSLKSEPLTLNVKPLPQEGRPEAFNGAVGQFNFDVTVGPQEAEVGDPLTVRMNLEGTGFLADTELPAIRDSSDFKVYEPSRKSDKGSESLEQVVIPLSEKIAEFPAVTFAWFDPSDGKYHSISKGPFPLTIKPASQKAQTYAASPASPAVVLQEQPETLGQDIVFIKDHPGHLRPSGARLYRSRILYAGLAGCAVIWAVMMLALVFRRRLKTDPAFAARLKAGEDARRGLVQLRKAGKNPAEFYERAHQLLVDYFSRKLQMPPGEVSASAVTGHPRWKAPDDVNRFIADVFAEGESVRFALMNVSEDQMLETLKKIETVIRHSEKVIR